LGRGREGEGWEEGRGQERKGEVAEKGRGEEGRKMEDGKECPPLFGSILRPCCCAALIVHCNAL